jgi:hypothetical protein
MKFEPHAQASHRATPTMESRPEGLEVALEKICIAIH